MERERIIKGLKTLRDKGECVSQTLVLDEAIKLIEEALPLFDEGKIYYKGFYIYKTFGGFAIDNANEQQVRVCDSIAECKRRIDWQEV